MNIVSFIGVGICASTFMALLGYLVNDYFDQEPDKLVGKNNFFAGRTESSVWFMPICAIAALVTWLPLNPSAVTWMLLVAEISLLIIYSVPPIRLKQTIAGAGVDAMYSRVLPMLVMVSFSEQIEMMEVFALSVWLFIAGLRNILLHQVDDFHSDRIAGQKTLVGRIGVYRAGRLILLLLIPLETIGWIVSLSMISNGQWVFVLTPFLYLLFIVIRHGIWSTFRKGKESASDQVKFIFNDLYADILPLLVLIVHAWERPFIWAFCLVHLAVFRQVPMKILRDAKAFFEMVRPVVKDIFKSVYYGFMVPFRIRVSRAVNNVVIAIFALFGVDLEKEELSAIGYLCKRFRI